MAGAFLPRPPSSSSFYFVGNERSDLKIGLALNYSLLTWILLFLMKPLGSSRSILGASGHSVEELLLHIGAQLGGLAYKCRENTWIWITGCHTALNLSSQIIL